MSSRCVCIAQLVEQSTLNRLVQGSSPCAGIILQYSVVATRHLHTVLQIGSIPITASFRECGVMVAHGIWDAGETFESYISDCGCGRNGLCAGLWLRIMWVQIPSVTYCKNIYGIHRYFFFCVLLIILI